LRYGLPEEGDTRERILDVALELFIEQATTRPRCARSPGRFGFTQAAIYYHFAAK